MTAEADLTTRLQVIDTINRFFLAVDTRHYSSARSLLTDQVDFDYSRMFGASMPNTADQMIEKVRSNHAGLHGIQHLISNHIVEVEGDTALCRSNYIAHHWFPNPQGDAIWAVGGRYRHLPDPHRRHLETAGRSHRSRLDQRQPRHLRPRPCRRRNPSASIRPFPTHNRKGSFPFSSPPTPSPCPTLSRT